MFVKSIRFQITLWSLTTLTAILFIGVIVAYAGFRAILRRETDDTLAAKAAQVTSLLRPTVDPGESTEADDLPDPVAVVAQSGQSPVPLPGVTADVLYVRLARADNQQTVAVSRNLQPQARLLASLAALPRCARPTFVWAGPDEETRMRCLTVPVAQTPYVLQVATPWDHTEDLLTELLVGLSGIALLFLLLSGIGSWLLVGRTLRPIDAIVSEAERLSTDQFSPILLNPLSVSDNEVGHLVAALNRMMSRLYAAFEAQRQFTADASHELRTPLTIMQGQFELALARVRPAGEYRRTLESGLEETARMAHIVDSLSLLARGDAARGKGTVERSVPVALDALVEEVTTALTRRAEDKGLHISIQKEPTPTVIEGEPEALRRVVRNLLENAIMYTPSGGDIRISVEAALNECRIAVTDTGVGIAEEDRAHIFDRFYRADKARINNGGSGLGLSIVQSIVDAHGGRIEVASEPGVGSRFIVILPAY